MVKRPTLKASSRRTVRYHGIEVRIWTVLSLIAFTLFHGYGLYNEALFPFVSAVHTYVMTGMVLVGFVITLMLGGWRLRMPVWILASFGYATYTWLTTLWAANAGKAVDAAITAPRRCFWVSWALCCPCGISVKHFRHLEIYGFPLRLALQSQSATATDLSASTVRNAS